MSRKKAVRAIVINGDKLLTMKRNKFGSQYYTLIGGGVDLGEDLETALRRELREETGFELNSARLVFVEDAGELYGEQYIYLCECSGDKPTLAADSEEAAITAIGQNTYEPIWLPLTKISEVTFRSSSVRDALLEAIRSGFPDTPQQLAWKG